MAQTLQEKGAKVENLLASNTGRATAKAATSYRLWMLTDRLEIISSARLDRIENHNSAQRPARLERVWHQLG